MSDDPFLEYEKYERKTIKVVVISEDNIVAIAKLVKGTVDYSDRLPKLLSYPTGQRVMPATIGMKVSIQDGKLANADNFDPDRDGWILVTDGD